MFQEIVFVLALIAIGDAITFDKQINIRSESDAINRSKQNLLSTLMGLLLNGSDRQQSLRSTPQNDEQNGFKKSTGNLVSQKSSLISFGPMLLESIFSDAFKTGDELVKNKMYSIKDASNQLVYGVKTAGKVAVGLAVKGVRQVTNGVTVIKGIILKPVFFVVGSQMKILGSGLKVLGSGTQSVGTAIKDAGKAIKAGTLGFGATCITVCTEPLTTPAVPPTEPTPTVPLTEPSTPTEAPTEPSTPTPTSTQPTTATTPKPKPEWNEKYNKTEPSFNKPKPTLGAPDLPTSY
jgi:hypothetical protein